MAITKNDAKITGYNRADPPFKSENLVNYLVSELDKLRLTVSQLVDLCPQVADAAPVRPKTGMIRWAKAPWDPLGTGDGLVKWNGSAWTAV